MKYLALAMLTCLAFGQELRRPTSDANGGAVTALGCGGTVTGSTAMPLSYDAAGLTTVSGQSIGATNFLFQTRLFSSWQLPGTTYSSLTLNINSSSAGWIADSDPGASGGACIAYSVNSGGTWTSVVCDASGNGWAKQTFIVTLSPAQDLSQLRVGVCVSARGRGGKFPLEGGDAVSIWDIWTLSNAGGGGNSGNGSSNGNAHRATVTVN